MALWRIDLETGAVTHLTSRRGAPDVIVSPDGDRLALVRPSGTEIWSLDPPRLVHTARSLGEAAEALGPRGAFLLGGGERTIVYRHAGVLRAEGDGAGPLRIAAGGRAVAEYPPMIPLSFSPDDQHLLVQAGHEVRLLDVSPQRGARVRPP